jgi:hypothetical protein
MKPSPYPGPRLSHPSASSFTIVQLFVCNLVNGYHSCAPLAVNSRKRSPIHTSQLALQSVISSICPFGRH